MRFSIAASFVTAALLCLLVAVIAAANEKPREPINVLPKRTQKIILLPSCAQISSSVSTSDGSKKVRVIRNTTNVRVIRNTMKKISL